MDAFLIITVGALVAINSSLLGSFLVLRKMVMVGDSISHSVLPGIVLGFLITESRNSIPMMIGATAFGLLSIFLIELFHKRAKVQSDAAIGISYTALFALGIILVSMFTGKIDLDLDCVLFGEIAYVPLDLLITENGFNMGPKAIWINLTLLLFISIFLFVGWKALVLSSFNEAYAISIGLKTTFWNYALLFFVSLSTVVSFESVGAILVIGFLIIPASSAYLLTENLKKMLLIACLNGIISSILGYFLAAYLNASISGAMIVISSIIFVAALVYQQIMKKSNQMNQSVDFLEK